MNNKPFAFLIAEPVTGEVTDLTGSHYDPQQQLWVRQPGAVAATCCNHNTSFCTCCIDGCTEPDPDCFTTVDGSGTCQSCG